MEPALFGPRIDNSNGVGMEREVPEGLHIRVMRRTCARERCLCWAMTELTLPPHTAKLVVAHWHKIG